MGVQVMTREHISLACALHIPMYVVVTKCDIAPPNIMKTTKMALAKLLRSYNKMPFPVKDQAAVKAAVDAIVSERVTPVFTVSSVTGQGMDLLKEFIARIKRLPSKYTIGPNGASTKSDGEEGENEVKL
jgi:GTPase